jgi:hypothetical protein
MRRLVLPVEARPLQTSITLVLEHVDPELARAHRELYPERIPEQIPFSLTLLYPWLPAAKVTEAELERLRTYFATCPALKFDLTRVTEFPGMVAYAVPEPDDELRAMMRGLWKLYPECPPYGRPGSDPPPHATLARYANPANASFDEVKKARRTAVADALSRDGGNATRRVRAGSHADPRDVSVRERRLAQLG